MTPARLARLGTAALGALAAALLAACPAAPDTGATTPAAPAAPPGAPVSLLELLPPQASAGALIDVARLRESSHGPALTNMLRRLGIYRWEDALGADLRTQVERLVVFGVADPEAGPGDLSQVLETLRRADLGAVVELRADAVAGDGLCRDSDLQGLQGAPIDQVAAGYRVFRCGRLIVARRGDALGLHRDGQLARALEGAARSDQLVFVAVASTGMIDRVSCREETTVALTGWQQATIELGDGMTLRGRYNAASPADEPRLEQCVSDGMGGFSAVPLFSQLQLGDVLHNATIGADPGAEGVVLLEASFSEQELDLMLGLLELVGTELE